MVPTRCSRRHRAPCSSTTANAAARNTARGAVNVGFFADKTTRANAAHWGLWHELEHENEPQWEYNVFPEVQVNRYSVLACRMLSERNDFDYGPTCKLGGRQRVGSGCGA